MEDRGALTQPRSLLARGDGAGVVAALSGAPWPADSLQLIGHGLVVAVRTGASGSVELARVCVIALGERRGDGDQELAEALEVALGAVPMPMLRPLPADLEELAMILQGDPIHGGGRVDLRAGDVWPQCAVEYAREVGEIGEEGDDDPVRWLWVDSAGAHPFYCDMEWFIEDLDDADFADRLARGDRRARSLRSVQRPLVGASRAHHEVARLLWRPPTRAGP